MIYILFFKYSKYDHESPDVVAASDDRAALVSFAKRLNEADQDQSSKDAGRGIISSRGPEPRFYVQDAQAFPMFKIPNDTFWDEEIKGRFTN